MKISVRTYVLGAILLAGIQARAADVAGAKDPANFKRFEGSEIVRYVKNSYAPYKLARAKPDRQVGAGFTESETVEGEELRLIYLVPEGHSALEVLRNYEEMLTEAGLSKNFELGTDDIKWPSYFVDTFYYQNKPDSKYQGQANPFENSSNPCYLTAEGTSADGRKMTVALLVSEAKGHKWHPEGLGKQTVAMNEGQAVVGLDVILSKAIANKMVVVKADDMAKALADAGKIDLYGIYFDVDKSDIKPESNATLAEIATLLKDDPLLKLEVGGHTDNTGSAEHNVKLSQTRADAVVRALTMAHGIDAARLQAKGYGDTAPVASNDNDAGRSKNRRVQLRKI